MNQDYLKENQELRERVKEFEKKFKDDTLPSNISEKKDLNYWLNKLKQLKK